MELQQDADEEEGDDMAVDPTLPEEQPPKPSRVSQLRRSRKYEDDTPFRTPVSSQAPSEEPPTPKRGPRRNMTKLETLSALASRRQWSHNDTALLATGTNDDQGTLSSKTIYTRHKVMRARVFYGHQRTKDRLKRAKNARAVYLDEKRNKTILRRLAQNTIAIDGEGMVKAKGKSEEPGTQEHCPIIFFTPEGGEIYVKTVKTDEEPGNNDEEEEDGVSAEDMKAEKPAKKLAKKVNRTLGENDSVHSLRVVGSDSCPKMTGHKYGFARWLERILKRALLRVLCLKHIVEIIWHHFFKLVDGETSGPTTLKGVVGQQIQKPHHWTDPIVTFAPIQGGEVPNFSKEVLNSLSRDVKYMWRMFQAISTGSSYFKNDLSLAIARPGNFSNARWITLCNHVLRLYVSAEKPTEELVKLVTFLVKVYIPAWFDIVLNPSILQSPKILQRIAASLDELDQQDFFTKEEKEDMVDTYNHSAYACHHEMVLVAMLVDDDLAKRELACKTIKEIREKKEAQPAKRGPKPIRDFQPPKVCSTEMGWSHIKDYTDFIPSFKDTANMTEPPITMDFDDDKLEAIVRDPVNNFPKLYWDMPNHTTCVERKIKLVTFFIFV